MAHKGQRNDAPVFTARVGIDQVRATQLAFWVVNRQAVLVENAFRQLVIRPRLEPLLIGVVHEFAVRDLFTQELIVVEEVAAQTLDELAQRRTERALFGRAFAVGKAHGRSRIADMQRPHVGHDIAPGGNLNLHAEVGQNTAHVGNGLLQRQVFAFDVGAAPLRRAHQQRLGVLIDVLDHFDLELGAGLNDLLHCTAVDGAQDAFAILFRDIFRQLDLDFEDLLVAVFRVDDVVLRQANVLGGNIARVAVHLDEVGGTHSRRRQEVVKRARGRAVALVANRLVGDDRKIVELGLQAEVVEIVNFDFHKRASRVMSVPERQRIRRMATIIQFFARFVLGSHPNHLPLVMQAWCRLI